MSGTFRSSDKGGVSGGVNVVIPKPAGVVAADFLLGLLTGNFNSATFGTLGAGFGPEDGPRSLTINGEASYLYSKIASGGEPADYTWVAGGPDIYGGVVGAWSGIAGIAAIAVSSSNAANASPVTVTFPTVTTTAPNQTVLLVAVLDVNNSGSAAWSSLPGGYTPRISTSFAIPDYGMFWVADGVQATQGATGTKSAIATLTGPTSSGWIAYSIALADISAGRRTKLLAALMG